MNKQLKLFLLGFPDGIRAKCELVDMGKAKYTLWDRVRYFLITGVRL